MKVKNEQSRVVSIDVLRGATIALMILVNDPGDPHEVYPPLRHAAWNGYTLADLVFPNFLFLGGASLVFSLQGKVERGEPRLELARGLGKRAVNLLLLKLVLAELPTFRLRRIRIFGVLFRTALCSLAAGLVLLTTLRKRNLLGVMAVLLGGYYAALRVPMGGLNQPLLDSDNNLAAWLDRKIAHLLHGELHTGALYNVTHDPEGLLSSVPAVATMLAGACAALVMRDKRWTPGERALVLAVAGAASLGAGAAWSKSFPVNKNLWTSSYVLVAAGWSLLALAGCYWVLDALGVQGRSRFVRGLTLPARIFGANALVSYAVSVAGHKLLRFGHIQHQGHSRSLRTVAYRETFGGEKTGKLRSVAFAATYAAVCFLPNLWLWKRKIFVRI